MGKISYEIKMRIQTFHEISLWYWIIVTNFPENYARNEAPKVPSSERRRHEDRGAEGAEEGGVLGEGVSPSPAD